MSERAPSGRGFSLVELLLVVAVLAVAAAVAVPTLFRARRSAGLGDAETATRAELQSAMTRAASATEATPFTVSALAHADGVAIDPEGLRPPDGTVAAATIVFQPGTGYPAVDGVRRPVAVVIADADDARDASSIVVGSSGTLRLYRLGANGWEEQP
jgi:prepilin-type N-terminal cleavage/methylation domain-containing protein